MGRIWTVLGAIDPQNLGFCQSHEHIAMRRGASSELNPALCIDDYDKSLAELLRYREAGGNAIVEAQPTGCCRDARWLEKLSRESGVLIIASAGFHKMSFYPADHWIHSISQKELEKIFVTELTEGMFDDGDSAECPSEATSVKAGLIKTAYDSEQLTERYRRLFAAAAGAALESGRNLMIHVENGTDPVPLWEYLTELGMPAHRMMFCHMDRACRDIALHLEILRRGSYLEYDTIGRFKYHDDAYEIDLFRRICDAGYEDRLLYSLDTTRARLKAYEKDAVGLDYILSVFNPLLREAGFTEEMIRKFSVKNPARFFAG